VAGLARPRHSAAVLLRVNGAKVAAGKFLADEAERQGGCRYCRELGHQMNDCAQLSERKAKQQAEDAARAGKA
jgi:hypothetical protein